MNNTQRTQFHRNIKLKSNCIFQKKNNDFYEAIFLMKEAKSPEVMVVKDFAMHSNLIFCVKTSPHTSTSGDTY